MSRRTPLPALLLAAGILLAGGAPATAEDPDMSEIWALYPSDNGGQSRAYGTPETDNVAISFHCRAGEGAVHAFIPLASAPSPEPAVGAHWRTTVSLRSGAVRRAYPARGEMTELGPMVSDLRLPLSDPLIQSLRRSFSMGDDRGAWPARSPGERRAITRFFARCQAR